MPVNLLKQKLKPKRFGKVTAMSPGSSPHRSLEAKAIYTNDDMLYIEGGTVPATTEAWLSLSKV